MFDLKSMLMVCAAALCSPQSAIAYEPTSSYLLDDINGWQVRYSSKYNSQPAKFEEMKTYVQQQLDIIVDRLPATAVATLRSVDIWVEYDPETDGGAYHPSREWLEENDINPDKALSVELGYSDFVDQGEQPVIVLQEMAHAFEHYVLSDYQSDLEQAYNRALTMDVYLAAKHTSGEFGRAYALTDKFEFFAELSEAYFARNDFSPFDNEQLRKLDPQSHDLIRQLWNIN